MGVNAIHRLGMVLDLVDGFDDRMPTVDGCEYRESLQAVRVDGGIANNVVPDEVRLVLNHRYAPDRTKDEAFQAICELLSPVDRHRARRPDRARGLLPGGGAQSRPSVACGAGRRERARPGPSSAGPT